VELKKKAPIIAMFLLLAPAALFSMTWYVNGVNGNDANDCNSHTTPCKTLGHAISLAAAGDSVMVSAATYTENLHIGISLRIVGSGSTATIIDGGGKNTVVTVSNIKAHVSLSKLKIQNGAARWGGGIYNVGTLAISSTVITANHVSATPLYEGGGGGIYNIGAITISDSTISGNQASGKVEHFVEGGGILNEGRLTLNRSTISGNSILQDGTGGGISNEGTAILNNSTISGNAGFLRGGGIISGVTTAVTSINNSTIAGNTTLFNTQPGGVDFPFGKVTMQNTIVSNNSGENCLGTITSKGYNLSSDGSCAFDGPGDLNNTNPLLSPLADNGGPTQTMALPAFSRAIDAGNPTGCTDGSGHLLKTDQRGEPRPDEGGRCDMGAYELQR